MSGRNKLADIPGKPLPERQSNLLADLWDEATGAFARYGRRSGAQRDASLALMSQAADPNTDPLTGVGMKALGLAGLVTHPLAFFPTREEWDQRLQAAGNDSRIGRSIGGFLSDLPSLIDPQMAAGGAALAAAPIAAKMMNKADDAADAGIIAYHGSPHSFDKFEFSDRTRSSGEGTQVIGDGLYFAEEEKVAQAYKDLAARQGRDAKMYQVRLDISPDNILDWDKPLSADASDAFKEAINNVHRNNPEIKEKFFEAYKNKEPGWYYYSLLSQLPKTGDFYKNQQFATKAFRDAGIKAIRYLDEGSRGAGKGTSNYVVFDDKLITILKKYGIPMTAGAGGAMMVAGQDMPPEFASQMGGT